MVTMVTSALGPIGSTCTGIIKDLGMQWADGARWCRTSPELDQFACPEHDQLSAKKGYKKKAKKAI